MAALRKHLCENFETAAVTFLMLCRKMLGNLGAMVPGRALGGTVSYIQTRSSINHTLFCRPLAWQEAHIALASIFQKFDLVLDDPSYQLQVCSHVIRITSQCLRLPFVQIKSTLTIKPADLRIRAHVREGAPLTMHLGTPAHPSAAKAVKPLKLEGSLPLYIAYGSNSGTCKDFAQRVGTQAPAKGESQT